MALDALGSRVAELLGSGVPPPGFDRVLDVLPCRPDLGVCEQGGGDRTALVDRPVAAYEQAPARPRLHVALQHVYLAATDNTCTSGLSQYAWRVSATLGRR